jgi:hypothetical protein
MVGTIVPMVHGEHRSRTSVILGAHCAGYVLGAAAAGTLLALLGVALWKVFPLVPKQRTVLILTGFSSLEPVSYMPQQ